MKSWHRILIIVLALTIILSLILSACGLVDNGSNNSNKGNEKNKDQDIGNSERSDKVTICHQTGSTKKPYVEITVSSAATVDGHATHENDIIPAPEGGCPTDANE